MGAAQMLRPAAAAVDHLLLGAADLERGIAWVDGKTGVKAALGGSHPGVGTRNAVLSLGGRQYLEIIAPDPAQSAFNFQIDIRTLTEPRLITWAAGTNDIGAIANRARDAGNPIFGPRGGSRARPDGKTLEWKSLGILNKMGGQGVEPFPFFIEWDAASVHPSRDSPGGCRLEAFQLEHPDPASLMEALKQVGIETNVRRAEKVRLHAVLATPKGRVELT